MSDTIFSEIRADHKVQRELIAQLVETTGDSQQRREIFEALTSELTSHAGAEERFLYRPLMTHDKTQEHARHSVAEHHELDEMIEQLRDYEMGGPAWLPAAKELQDRLGHHLDEEEVEIFPVAGKVLSEEEKAALAIEYRADMDRRRTEG